VVATLSAGLSSDVQLLESTSEWTHQEAIADTLTAKGFVISPKLLDAITGIVREEVAKSEFKPTSGATANGERKVTQTGDYDSIAQKPIPSDNCFPLSCSSITDQRRAQRSKCRCVYATRTP